MPRFIPEKWKPEHDSTPGVAHLDPSKVVLYVNRTEEGRDGCPCGCGEFPEGEKAIFRMGHDARLRGKLIRAFLMGVSIVQYIDEHEHEFTAMEMAKEYDWEEYLWSAQLKRDGKNRELLQQALKDPNLLKAGKWAYTGGQVFVMYKPNPRTGMQDVAYVNQAGDIRKIRIPASQAEEMAQ